MKAPSSVHSSRVPGGIGAIVSGGSLGGRHKILHLTVFYLAYVAAGALGQGLAIIPGVSITIWPPAGLLTGVLLMTSRQSRIHWLAVAGLGELTCNWFWFHNPIQFAVIYFLANAIEALITATLTGWLAGAGSPFETIKSSSITIFVGAVISPVVGALIIASTDAIIGKHTFGVAFPLTWIGDATGFLIVAPVTISLITEWQSRHKFGRQRYVEAAAVLLLLTGVCTAALQSWLPTVYFALPFVIWAALRFQLTGASLAIAIVMMATAVSVVQLPTDKSAEFLIAHTIYLQCFLSITAFSSILVAALSLQHKIALDRLTELNESLEERVVARTAELAESARKLRQADVRKNHFLATLAHELRNPVAAIQSSIHLLMNRNVGIEERNDATDIASRQVYRIIRMVDDLLDVNRIALGKFVVRKEVVQVNEVVQVAVESCRPIIEDKQQQLTVELSEECLTIEVDVERLTQVFVNLLTNATKYTPRGGQICIEGKRFQNEVVVTFTDTGNGIPEHMIERVFEMFTQLDGQDIEETRGGLGIGLTLSKAIIELLGGSLTARSGGVQKGSQFEVRFPLSNKPLAVKTTASLDKVSTATQRVLIVDDNRDAAESLALICKLHNHEVKTSYSGQSAIECGKSFLPSLILLDLGMPNMDGYETCRRIRVQSWGENTVIVALTGWGQAEEHAKALEAGFNYHVVKPIEIAALQKLLSCSDTLDKERSHLAASRDEQPM